MPSMPSSSFAVASGPEDPHIPISPAPASTAMLPPGGGPGEGATALPPQPQTAAVRTHDATVHETRPPYVDTGAPPCYRFRRDSAALFSGPGASISNAGGVPMLDRPLSPHQVLIAPREALIAGGAAEEYEQRA